MYMKPSTWLALRMLMSSWKTVSRFLSRKPSHSYCTWFKQKEKLVIQIIIWGYILWLLGLLTGALNYSPKADSVYSFRPLFQNQYVDFHHSPSQQSAGQWKRCWTCEVCGSGDGACRSGAGHTASAPSSHLNLWASDDHRGERLTHCHWKRRVKKRKTERCLKHLYVLFEIKASML